METIANKNVSMHYLQKYEQKAKKKFGQNFIIDPSVVRTIAKHSGEGDLVLEIGPGLGALTQQLAFNYKKVVAYEIDIYMVEILKESLEGLDNVDVFHQDFLKADLSVFEGASLDVCANLPYYITTPLLFKLMDLNINRMTLMVQKEIGDRLGAKVNTKEYNALSIQIQYYFNVKQVMKVSKESFHPQPNVDSIVIQLTPKHQSMPYDETLFFEFVRGCFQFRRKTLANNLKAMNLDNVNQKIESVGLDVRVRAEALEFESFLKLYEVFYDA